MFEAQLLGSFCKKLVPPLTEYDHVIDTQSRNCMCSQIVNAMPLHVYLAVLSNTRILLTGFWF